MLGSASAGTRVYTQLNRGIVPLWYLIPIEASRVA